MGSMARLLRNVVARLIWCAVDPQLGPSRMPLGWMRGQFESIVRIRNCPSADNLASLLQKFFSGYPEPFFEFLHTNLSTAPLLFDQAAIEADMEFLCDFFSRQFPHALTCNAGARIPFSTPG